MHLTLPFTLMGDVRFRASFFVSYIDKPSILGFGEYASSMLPIGDWYGKCK